MPRCIECGQLAEYCVCTQDLLLEDEEYSNYINLHYELQDNKIKNKKWTRNHDEV